MAAVTAVLTVAWLVDRTVAWKVFPSVEWSVVGLAVAIQTRN